MNANRRKLIADARGKLERLVTDLDNLKVEIESLKDEEGDYLDAMPEGLKNGDKGDSAQAAFDAMEEAETKIEEAIDAIGDAVSNLDCALE